MKKIYSKPLIKKLYKGQEIHPYFIKYGFEPEPDNNIKKTVDLKNVDKLNQFLEIHSERIFTFSTEYLPSQLKKLRKSLIDNNFISDSITENQFIYIFTGQLITDRMKPIKWKIRWGGKESLRCFLELLLLGKTVHRDQVKKCFIDWNNKPFLISKPTGETHGYYYFQLEKIIDST
ncbi:MAG TPA: hypothetical protein VIK14_15295 [Ignavibacteria bacterium]